MDVELLLTPHRPNAAAARTVLTACPRRLDLERAVRERVGVSSVVERVRRDP